MKEVNYLKVVIVEPDIAPYEADIPNTLKAEQEIVGGLITVSYPYEEPVGIISNDESLLIGMPFNRSIEGGYGGIFGPFIVCGLEGEGFCSLTPEQVERYKKKFHKAEILLAVKGNEVFTMKVEPKPKERPDQPQRPPKAPAR